MSFPSAAVLAAAFTVSGCAEQPTVVPEEYTQVCVNETTDQRVPDDQCPDDRHHYGFVHVYYPWHVPVPGIGHPASGAHHVSRPAGAVITLKAPSEGRPAVKTGIVGTTGKGGGNSSGG